MPGRQAPTGNSLRGLAEDRRILIVPGDQLLKYPGEQIDRQAPTDNLLQGLAEDRRILIVPGDQLLKYPGEQFGRQVPADNLLRDWQKTDVS